MSKPLKLSIIIPVYNTEEYLTECLESCCDQGLEMDEYEIIVVNDGSTDASLRMALDFADTHSCVHVISRPNTGQGVARNDGLAQAKGEYVWFVDSDDWIAAGCIPKLLSICRRKRLDILAIGSARCKGDTVRPDNYYPEKFDGKVITGRKMMRRGLYRTVCVPFMILRREYLLDNQLSFAPGLRHEDEEYTPRVVYNAARVSFLSSVSYFARVREGSSMRTYTPVRSFDLVTIAGMLDSYGASVPPKDRFVFSRCIVDVLNASLKLSRDYCKEDRSALQALIYSKKQLLDHFLRCRILKFQLEGLLLKAFPKRTVRVYGFLQRNAARLGLSTERKL